MCGPIGRLSYDLAWRGWPWSRPGAALSAGGKTWRRLRNGVAFASGRPLDVGRRRRAGRLTPSSSSSSSVAKDLLRVVVRPRSFPSSSSPLARSGVVVVQAVSSGDRRAGRPASVVPGPPAVGRCCGSDPAWQLCSPPPASSSSFVASRQFCVVVGFGPVLRTGRLRLLSFVRASSLLLPCLCRKAKPSTSFSESVCRKAPVAP